MVVFKISDFESSGPFRWWWFGACCGQCTSAGLFSTHTFTLHSLSLLPFIPRELFMYFSIPSSFHIFFLLFLSSFSGSFISFFLQHGDILLVLLSLRHFIIISYLYLFIFKFYIYTQI